MKKRAHIPHDYEMSYEIYQGKFYACGCQFQKWIALVSEVGFSGPE